MEDIAISMEFQSTPRREIFFTHDSKMVDSDQLLVFTTETDFELLERYTAWYADGTFKSCFSLFYQVSHVNAVINNCSLPGLLSVAAKNLTEISTIISCVTRT